MAASSSNTPVSGVDADPATVAFQERLKTEAPPPVAQEVLNFWFDLDSGEPIRNKKWWWRADAEVDESIRVQFGACMEEALAGGECGIRPTTPTSHTPSHPAGLEEWEGTITGTVAKIIVLDQFPRNTYRGSGKSYSGDKLVRRACVKQPHAAPPAPPLRPCRRKQSH